MGGHHSIVSAVKQATKTNNQQYGMTLDGRCLMMLHTKTNQKHGAMEQFYKRRCTMPLFWGALEVERR
jgi:hypothetical protein